MSGIMWNTEQQYFEVIDHPLLKEAQIVQKLNCPSIWTNISWFNDVSHIKITFSNQNKYS